MKRSRLAALAFAIVAVPAAARASDTISYTYDALGRLTATTVSGGPNTGMAVSTGYDPAGNRTNYSVALGTALTTTSSGAGPGESGTAAVDTVTLEEAPGGAEAPAGEPAPAEPQQEEASADESPEGGR